MTVRVTANEVKVLLDDSQLPDATVEAFITSANVQVNSILSNSGLSTEVLKEIERWLSAHMIAVTRERVAVSETAGPASTKYANVFGEGLKSTPYGQMVLELDTTGSMLAAGKASFTFKAVRSFDS